MTDEKTQVRDPFIIVFGNEKGGTGKSTLAMHLIVYLLYEKYKVGSIDTDGRQGTLSRYMDNRLRGGQDSLPVSQHHRITKDQYEENGDVFKNTLHALRESDFIVIDTPGTDSALSREAHSYADILITPINDSFIDLDLLIKLDKTPDKMLHPSVYAEMVFEQRKHKAASKGKPIQWIVVRNRLGHLYTKNKEQVDEVLHSLAKRIGFDLASGFGERVIFRELFLSGRTLLDMHNADEKMNFSHAAARQELRSLMRFIPKTGS